MNKQQELILKVSFIIFVILFIMLFLIENKISIFTFYKTPNNETDIINSCQNKSLENTAKCLVGNINTFYKYKLTDDSLTLTFDQLKKQGGDCKNYAELYQRLGNKLGFFSHSFTFDISNSLAHEVTIISNAEGYCVLDQIEYWCVKIRK